MSAETQQLDDLKRRVEALESRSSIPGPVGPRGPAGDIEAAVRNATSASNKAVADAEKRVQAKADAACAKLKAQFDALKKYIDERIEAAVVNHTVQTLEDYGVVSSFDNKRITVK